MDHIKTIRDDTKTKLASPNSGVSQSKFLSPCRRVGLKRSSNKFVVKFKNSGNIDTTSDITSQNKEERESLLDSKSNIDCDEIIDSLKYKELQNVSSSNFEATSPNKNLVKKNGKTKNQPLNAFKVCPKSPDLMENKSSHSSFSHCDDILLSDVFTQNNIICDHRNEQGDVRITSYPNLNKSDDLPEELCKNFERGDFDETSSDMSESNISNVSYDESNITGTNSSLCESLNNSTLNIEDNAMVNTTKVVKRFKNPMKQKFICKKLKLDPSAQTQCTEASDILKGIAEKEKKIAEIKMTISNSLKHNLDQLDSLITKWRQGAQDALQELLSEIHRRGKEDYTMDKLLVELNIPHELVRWSETNEEFY